jgi:hypothetical protein
MLLKELRPAMLAKYVELRHTVPASQLSPDGFEKGSVADQTFNTWYAKTRRNKIAGTHRNNEQMARHARWHLMCVLQRMRERGERLPRRVPVVAQEYVLVGVNRRKATA